MTTPTPKDKIAQVEKTLIELEEKVKNARSRAAAIAGEIYPKLERDAFKMFLKEPYVLIQKRGYDWYCIAPKFIDFSVGWLEFASETYNVFLVNRYTLWLGEVPEFIRKATGLEQPPASLQVAGGQLLFKKRDKEEAAKYRKFLHRMGDESGQIIKGREFHLLAEMIDDGHLPFVPQPIAPEDYREPQVNFNFEGKYQFQEEAYQKFLKLGAVGVYWMTGSGKSFFAMKALDSIKGEKFLVVPTLTLIDQWRDYFKQYAPRLSDEVEVVTYNAYEKLRNKQPAVMLFDECHRLPANSFSRLATIKTKYRIGLSASPYREDGRTNYIFALTGFPLGMEWRSLMKILGKDYHTVNVWIVTTRHAKLLKINELLNRGIKTMIFSDGIEFGEQIAKKYALPFIHGGTNRRMDTAKEATAFVASRVMDLGVSLKDLEHIIEADFLFGSRQQEIQRTGRLFHSFKKARHDILMTREEFDAYQKRLHGLIEKGFKINVHQ